MKNKKHVSPFDSWWEMQEHDERITPKGWAMIGWCAAKKECEKARTAANTLAVLLFKELLEHVKSQGDASYWLAAHNKEISNLISKQPRPCG